MFEINDTRMTLTVNGTVIAEAARVDGAWHVTTWPTPLTYNQAITALMIVERLAMGHDETDPFVIAWREELADG